MTTLTNLFGVALFLPVALSAQTAFDVALLGDMPYGTTNELRFERVIADINRQNVEFSIHIGDTKSGSQRCDDSHYIKTLNWFNSFEKPLLYSPGDNEWTDCVRVSNGAYNPVERLALIRRTYFPSNLTLGRRPVIVQRQSEDPKYSLYPENTILVKAPVVFATLHMPGSNNNLEYRTRQGAPNPFYDDDKEYTARNAANIAWLRKVFQTARDSGSLGVMISTQANVFEYFLDPGTGSKQSGFVDFVAVLREETNKFKGEVVLVSGDTHFMRVDKPLTDLYPACLAATGDCVPFDAAVDARGTQVLNFTRVEVPGLNTVHWVLAHIRPASRNLFQFEFMIVPEAGVAATGITPVIAPAGTLVAENTYETGSGQIQLDATRSTSANSGTLTYSWTSAPGYPLPGMVGETTATPRIQFTRRGTYQLVVTVTDRTGASATSTITLLYV